MESVSWAKSAAIISYPDATPVALRRQVFGYGPNLSDSRHHCDRTLGPIALRDGVAGLPPSRVSPELSWNRSMCVAGQHSALGLQIGLMAGAFLASPASAATAVSPTASLSRLDNEAPRSGPCSGSKAGAAGSEQRTGRLFGYDAQVVAAQRFHTVPSRARQG